jgi:hypothetical protein
VAAIKGPPPCRVCGKPLYNIWYTKHIGFQPWFSLGENQVSKEEQYRAYWLSWNGTNYFSKGSYRARFLIRHKDTLPRIEHIGCNGENPIDEVKPLIPENVL